MEIDSGGKFDEIFDVEEEELNFVVCLWLGGEIQVALGSFKASESSAKFI
jgi:hypothetical protein